MPGWGYETRKRADKRHAAKKAVRKQKQHLRAIKTEAEQRRIRLAACYG